MFGVGSRLMTACRSWWTLLGGLLVLLCLVVGYSGAHAQSPSLWHEDEQRLRVGLKIFPAVLGAMESLDSRYSSDGVLQVLVVYRGAATDAQDAVRMLDALGEVRGLRLRVQALTVEGLDQFSAGPVAGVFVASTAIPGARLGTWSERLQTLVFSPFAGDLEAGAVAGLYVADRILPTINLPAARRAGVSFKPFFLKVARHYE